MGSSILSLVGLGPSKNISTEPERTPFRTTVPIDNGSDSRTADINVLHIVETHAPIRLATVRKERELLLERLDILAEEEKFLVEHIKISDTYRLARDSRQKTRRQVVEVNVKQEV